MRGAVVDEVEAPNPRGQAAGLERLAGRTLEEVEARGKNLILGFGELSLHSHLGMNGSWHVYAPGERWRKPRYAAWAVLRGENAEAVQFGGPTLRVLRTDALRRDPRLARLGPDVLAPDYEPGDSIPLLRAADDRRLGDLLLDQGRVAGIGNIFKSEACFVARIDPWRRGGRARRRRALPGAARRAGADARRGRDRAPSPQRLQARRLALPALRDADPLARAGRRQPDHVLVSGLPGLTVSGRRRAGIEAA